LTRLRLGGRASSSTSQVAARDRGDSVCPSYAIAFAAPPLAHASSGAPLWAIIIALIVVVLALYLLFGPESARPSFLRSKSAESKPGEVPPAVKPGSGEGSAQ
jgi:hypothetical protein